MNVPHFVELKRNTSITYLATEGKFCDRNIAVNVNIDEQPILENGIAIGEERGRKAEYDAFWDAYQRSGTRTDYDLAFAGIGWRNTTYQPKYVTDIVTESGDTYGVLQPVSAARMYQKCKIAGHLEVDTSQCTAMDAMFISADAITSLGTIDTRKISALTGIFGYMPQLVTLRKLILKEDGTQTFSSSLFANDTALANVTIQGTIGNDFTMQYCPALTKESVESIISALSRVASGKTLTLHANVKNRFTADEWAALKSTRSNWTIEPA